MYVLAGVFLNALAQLALKLAANRTGPLLPEQGDVPAIVLHVVMQPAVWIGLLCYALSVGLWIVALSRVDVSVAYPFLSLGYVLTAIAAWQLFGEALSVQRLAAIGLICTGVALLYRS